MPWGVPKIGTVVEDATGNFDLVEPVGVVQGDLMVACIAYRGNAAITRPTGWEIGPAAQNSGDTDATNGIASIALFWIIRGASAPALSCTRTGGDVAQAQIIAYPGALQVSPYDTGTSNTLSSASVTATTGTFNTAEANELIVAATAAGDTYNASAFDATDPSTASGATDTSNAPTAGTWRERADTSTGTGADCGLAIADAIRGTAGATGTIQATIGGSAQHAMIAAAFKMRPDETPPSFPLNSVLDNFNRADVGPPPSSNWSVMSGVGAGDNLLVVSNQLESNATSFRQSYWNPATFGPDCESFSKIANKGTGVDNFRVFLRLNNPTNSSTITGYMIIARGSGAVEVYRRTGVTSTLLGAAISQTVTNGDSFGAVAVGNVIFVFYKVGAGAWTCIGQRVDYVHTGAGYIGVLIDQGGAGQVKLDDFGGGTVPLVVSGNSGFFQFF